MPLSVLVACLLAAADVPRPDVLLADFEGDTYGGWVATGTAFGTGPARGTLPGQMPVSGFKGRGLVNSFLGGDKSTGTLTSPEFAVSRHYLAFLIGGGRHPDRTCIQLLIDGKVVRSETGSDSERLEPAGWDVRELAGKKATLRILDEETGGWGHINIDHIVLTDSKPAGLIAVAERALLIDKRYLEIPVKTGAPKRKMSVRIDSRPWREFEVELAHGKPDFFALLDLASVKGKKAALRVERVPEGSTILDGVAQTDTPREATTAYREPRRPQFHFTSRRGWLNDPNGLVYYKGEWHLFYQHNPYGWAWGNMHWGHAVSTDLVRWRELPIALYPARFGDWAFSGSAVVDRANTSGFKSGDEDVLVLAYTSTGRGECIAYSNDRGRSWREYEGNPVVKHQGRDPKLIWHAGSRRWVMAVYDEQGGKRWIAFYSSPDLKTWRYESRIEGFFECPDLFELPVAGRDKEGRWVLYAADGKYVLGDFDGRRFAPSTGKQQVWHGNFYAAQTYSDAPDGRRIQIGWAQGIDSPGMPFNQQMTIPCELTLRPTAEGVRMFAFPVREVATLHGKKHTIRDLALPAKENPLASAAGELFDITGEFEPGTAEAIVFRVRGTEVAYDVKKQALVWNGGMAPLKPADGKLRLRLLADRGSVEAFGNEGAVAISLPLLAKEGSPAVEILARGGAARARVLEVIELRSAWREKRP
jgi:fructan beta-fructosidase